LDDRNAKGEGGFKTPLSKQIAAGVFARLTAQFGAKLLDHWAAVPGVRDEWGQALADLHPLEIDRGLRATQSRAFVPTLGEFMLLCRPALDPEAAWHEAAAGMAARDQGDVGEWSHPAVYRAATAFAWELRSSGYAAQRKAWAIRMQRELARGWGDVPPPTLRIANTPVRTGPPPGHIRALIRAQLASAGRYPKQSDATP
jgi:hypothetical protein